MSAQRLKPTDSLFFPIKAFKMFGFWHMEGKYKNLYVIYNYLFIIISIVYHNVSLIGGILQDGWGFFQMMANGLYLAINYTNLMFKVGFFNKKLLTDTITFNDSKIFTSQRKHQDCYIIEATRITKRNSIAILLTCTFVCTLWHIEPFINGKYKQKELAFKAWHPFSVKESPYYEMAYAYQYFGILFSAWVNISTDALIAGSMSLCFGQMEVLKNNLRNIRNNALENIGQFSDKNVCKLCDNREDLVWKCSHPIHLSLSDNMLEEEICKELQKCIKHHCAILMFIKNFQDTFSISLLSQISASLIDICTTAFVLSIIPPFTPQFISLFIYLLNIVAQILFYCWYGNEIYLTSLTLNNDLYFSNWYRCGPKVKKLILIMMERCKEPIILKGGKVYTLSLETFKSILRSTYSLYAVLQQMDIDEI